MTNKELIEKLKALPEDLEVLAEDWEWGYCPLNKVVLATVVGSSAEANYDNLIDHYIVEGVDVGQKFIAIS